MVVSDSRFIDLPEPDCSTLDFNYYSAFIMIEDEPKEDPGSGSADDNEPNPPPIDWTFTRDLPPREFDPNSRSSTFVEYGRPEASKIPATGVSFPQTFGLAAGMSCQDAVHPNLFPNLGDKLLILKCLDLVAFLEKLYEDSLLGPPGRVTTENQKKNDFLRSGFFQHRLDEMAFTFRVQLEEDCSVGRPRTGEAERRLPKTTPRHKEVDDLLEKLRVGRTMDTRSMMPSGWCVYPHHDGRPGYATPPARAAPETPPRAATHGSGSTAGPVPTPAKGNMTPVVVPPTPLPWHTPAQQIQRYQAERILENVPIPAKTPMCCQEAKEVSSWHARKRPLEKAGIDGSAENGKRKKRTSLAACAECRKSNILVAAELDEDVDIVSQDDFILVEHRDDVCRMTRAVFMEMLLAEASTITPRSREHPDEGMRGNLPAMCRCMCGRLYCKFRTLEKKQNRFTVLREKGYVAIYLECIDGNDQISTEDLEKRLPGEDKKIEAVDHEDLRYREFMWFD